MLISRSAHVIDSRLACINIDGVIRRLHVESDFLSLVLAGKSGNLSGIQRSDMADDSIHRLQFEVNVINSKFVIEP